LRLRKEGLAGWEQILYSVGGAEESLHKIAAFSERRRVSTNIAIAGSADSRTKTVSLHPSTLLLTFQRARSIAPHGPPDVALQTAARF
jgi:hypothetical protein